MQASKYETPTTLINLGTSQRAFVLPGYGIFICEEYVLSKLLKDRGEEKIVRWISSKVSRFFFTDGPNFIF